MVAGNEQAIFNVNGDDIMQQPETGAVEQQPETPGDDPMLLEEGEEDAETDDDSLLFDDDDAESVIVTLPVAIAEVTGGASRALRKAVRQVDWFEAQRDRLGTEVTSAVTDKQVEWLYAAYWASFANLRRLWAEIRERDSLPKFTFEDGIVKRFVDTADADRSVSGLVLLSNMYRLFNGGMRVSVRDSAATPVMSTGTQAPATDTTTTGLGGVVTVYPTTTTDGDAIEEASGTDGDVPAAVSGPLKGGRGYVFAGPEDDAALFAAAKDALPLFPDAYMVAAHMTDDGQRVLLAGGTSLSVMEFWARLQELPGYVPGMTLALVMCRADLVPAGGRSFADVLAELSTSDVWATDGDVWQTRLGKVVARGAGVSRRGQMWPELDNFELGNPKWRLRPGKADRASGTG